MSDYSSSESSESSDSSEDENDEHEPYDSQDYKDAEERQKTCCQRYGCHFFIIFMILFYISIFGLAAFCFWMSRHACERGVATVVQYWDSITWNNTWKVVSGEEVVLATIRPKNLTLTP